MPSATATCPAPVTQGLNFDVNVGGTQVPVDTTGLTTFQAVLEDVQKTAPTATMADVAAAFDTAGRLAAGGLLVCPPVMLAGDTKPSAISGLYGVTGAAFGLANAGVTGLLVAGTDLSAPDPKIAAIKVAENDTLNSIVGRFNAAYLEAGLSATVTVASLVDANADKAFFKQGATAVLPPADITLASTLTLAYPGPAFALTVEMTVARPSALVHSDFAGTAAESATADHRGARRGRVYELQRL